MTRGVDSNQQAAVTSDAIAGVAFVQLDFGTTLYLCSLPFSYPWNNQTWTGTGSLGGISAIQETADLSANGVQLSLSGVDTTLISTALGEQYQGKRAQIWFGPINAATGQLIGTPIRTFVGRIDNMQVDAGETATITLSVESRLADFFRPRISRYTDAEQQARWPGDLGLQYVNSLQDKTINWGKA